MSDGGDDGGWGEDIISQNKVAPGPITMDEPIYLEPKASTGNTAEEGKTDQLKSIDFEDTAIFL